MFDWNEFQRDLADLINRHCIENLSNTPDFILAEYLVGCLSNFQYINSQRETWYGIKSAPGGVESKNLEM